MGAEHKTLEQHHADSTYDSRQHGRRMDNRIDLDTTTPPPAHFCQAASDAFNAVIGYAEKLDFTESDRAEIERFAFWQGEFLRAQRAMAKIGVSNPAYQKLHAEALKSSNHAHRCAVRLGLTPKDRAALLVPRRRDRSKAVDSEEHERMCVRLFGDAK
ncbi:Phage terminase, small subunit [Symmachiella macrocystis]|uniref:Phage terminase, small subunit n=1 Tax=Symmachiella macrocystis TaxID=2527985 RepID=A0A5C6BAU3_9PLAN|nr:P27 family phage terminase small subunit [Symmachiella macrocystis]TWU08837.1 Phage terminase, small subunit [Symmachiella macrocystis]